MASKAEVKSTTHQLREVKATSSTAWTVTLDQLRDVVAQAEDMPGESPVTVKFRADSVSITRRYEHYVSELIVRNG